MDDMQRTLGQLEGRFDGLERQLDDIKELVVGNADMGRKVSERVENIEKTHARVTGFVAALSAIAGISVTWVAKKLSVLA
jgi:hypothetical protein